MQGIIIALTVMTGKKNSYSHPSLHSEIVNTVKYPWSQLNTHRISLVTAKPQWEPIRIYQNCKWMNLENNVRFMGESKHILEPKIILVDIFLKIVVEWMFHIHGDMTSSSSVFETIITKELN
jgi:hypothetical protein